MGNHSPSLRPDVITNVIGFSLATEVEPDFVLHVEDARRKFYLQQKPVRICNY